MNAGVLEAPRPLARSDHRSGFNSGAEELDDWLHRYAWQNQRADNAVTYVTVQDGQVLGYYALASACIAKEKASERIAKQAPQEIPCVLLARLAVDQRAQGQGIGAALLKDTMMRSLEVSRIVGARALLIHCRDEAAKSFYLANGDFDVSPIDNMQLLLSIKAIRELSAN
ncbi:GNAT family N-acetyltransferase [Actinomyces sp. MRS3W]|uniref:GNAT family N-acetyltransferase n=1 Tax=Actinomyces sp. MRS3W TaxID=2800796 RepID=UPI0028FD2CF5|nr:GNAT family N-acetyltransferase [Actinomyces sp. MRS3W]MDU0348100.1 GNAT family N-acetyltransferase [Actinomyces sp. MRS3W]